MSKIYDYEEYQNQRVKVTYTDKRKYREENIVGLYGQVIKTTSGSIAVQIDGMYNAASSNGLYWFKRSELDIIRDESEDNKMTGFNKVAIVNLVDDYNKKDYGFALYDEDMNEIVKYDTKYPLYVIVNARGKDNRVLGILKEIKSVEAYGKCVTAQVVGVVNMNAYNARIDEENRQKEIAKQKASIEKELKSEIEKMNNIALYEIVRDGVVIERIQDGSIVSYKDTDVKNKTKYNYEIIAYTNGGNAIKSNSVSVTPDLVMVEVTFKLKAPSYTPLDATITMPGAMNGWDVGSWEMSRNGAVTTDWTYTISVLEGETIEYKYVKGGSWAQEALMNYSNPKAANQSKYGCTTGEGGNEKVIVVNQGDGKMLVENEVVRWKDMPVVVLDPSTGSYTKNETITVRGNSMLDPNLTINGESVVVDENGNFAYAVKLNVGKNDIAIHIEPTEENKNNPDIFNNNEEAIGFATKDLNLEITRLEEGEEIPGPVINAEDKIVNLGDEFNPLDGVTAIDALGNDITEKIEVLENTVDTSKEGEYKVVYKVADDNGKEATREIKVTVTKNEEGKKPGIDIKHEEDNNKPGAIPKTGGTNVIYYIGIALILIAGGMYFTFKKKNIS